MAILKVGDTLRRDVLADAGFNRKVFDKVLAELLDNKNIYERQWIISDDKGRVIIYGDAGNSWCTIIYCSDEVIVPDHDVESEE